MVLEIRWKFGWASGPSQLVIVLIGYLDSMIKLITDNPIVLKYNAQNHTILAPRVLLIPIAKLILLLNRMVHLD
jgi:hypothetical protein